MRIKLKDILKEKKIGWGDLRAQDYFEAGFKIAKKTNNKDAVKAWKEWRKTNISDFGDGFA